jgi:hypothetical protein
MIIDRISDFLTNPTSGDAENLDPGREMRFESKFISERTNLDSITRWIQGHRAGFTMPYPTRQVNNIYFDTYDYRSYGDNLAGISRRLKTRLRWYGNSTEALPSPSLEFKHRRNKLGWKVTYPLDHIVLSANWKCQIDTISKQLPPEGRLIFQSFPMVTLINQYRRSYYLSSDGQLRVTVDTDINVFDQRNTMRPRFSPRLNLPEYLIVEFKFDHNSFQAVDDVIKHFPLRPSRSSKYVTGLKAIVEAV